MKNKQAVENVLAGISLGDATSSIYYTVRVLARNREYDPKTNNFYVAGLASEPNAKQMALSRKILIAIEKDEGRPIPELRPKDSAKYIHFLARRLRGLQKPTISREETAILLANIRKDYPPSLSSNLPSATRKAGPMTKRKAASNLPSATLKAGATTKTKGRV